MVLLMGTKVDFMKVLCSDSCWKILQTSMTALPSHGFAWASPVPPRFQQTNEPTAAFLCPTSRISFRLFDWNPGDFPRYLRQQILEWLSNMPVDLEGYIRHINPQINVMNQSCQMNLTNCDLV